MSHVPCIEEVEKQRERQEEIGKCPFWQSDHWQTEMAEEDEFVKNMNAESARRKVALQESTAIAKRRPQQPAGRPPQSVARVLKPNLIQAEYFSSFLASYWRGCRLV